MAFYETLDIVKDAIVSHDKHSNGNGVEKYERLCSRLCGGRALYFHPKSFVLRIVTFLDFDLGRAAAFWIKSLTLLLPHMLPVFWACRRGSLLISASREVTMFRKVLKVDNTDSVRCSLFSHHVHQCPALSLGAELEDFVVVRANIVITTLKIKCNF